MSSQRGSAMIYILIAIALIAILMSTLSDDDGGTGSQAQKGTKLISEISSQVDYINAAIQECILNHSKPDAKLTSTYQKNAPYPLNANSAYYTAMSATPGPAADQLIAGIRCAGNPGGADPNSQNHAPIFTNKTGRFAPVVPEPMTSWKYFNGTEGVFFWTETSKQDAYILPALQKLDAKFSGCETDLIVNSSGGAVSINSGGNTCSGNSICFRYWIIRKAGSVPVDAACP
jgi:hypothetical protein